MANSISAIFAEIDEALEKFGREPKQVIAPWLQCECNKRLERLDFLTAQLGNTLFVFSKENLIPHVYRKFKDSILKDGVYFSRSELRTLSYSLAYSEKGAVSIFESDNQLDFALALLSSSWKPGFIIGLINCYMLNWDTTLRKSHAQLFRFISDKFLEYQGNRAILLAFKANWKYFEAPGGDLKLGIDMAVNNHKITEVTEFLSLPNSWINFPYFSNVIIAYYEAKQRNLFEFISDIELILISHNSNKTSKRVISKIIIYCNSDQFAAKRNLIKNLAIKFIGDPENAALWMVFSGATENEKNDLDLARSILNQWIVSDFIALFFEICINDRRRKAFWLKYTKAVTSFKIYGSSSVKSRLAREQRIEEHIHSRFETVSGSGFVSAIVLYLKDYMLVEFSEPGFAFYAYKINNVNRPLANYGIHKIEDLRRSFMPSLATRSRRYITDVNEEGRLPHTDGELYWESIFEYWLKNVAKVYV